MVKIKPFSISLIRFSSRFSSLEALVDSPATNSVKLSLKLVMRILNVSVSILSFFNSTIFPSAVVTRLAISFKLNTTSATIPRNVSNSSVVAAEIV